MTRVVCEQASGRAMVVAAERNWGTPKLVEFARYANLDQTGLAEAGVLMVPMPPDWAGSCTTFPRWWTTIYAACCSRAAGNDHHGHLRASGGGLRPGDWGTPKLVEFARYAKQTGAGVLMVMPPDWAGSCTTATLVDHYAAAAGELPVMIITATFVPRGEAFGLETLKRAGTRCREWWPSRTTGAGSSAGR